MEPPIGFVALSEAADIVGRALSGKDWRPLAKTNFYVIEAKLNPEIERAIAMIAKACEAGEIEATYQSIAGVDSLDRGVWHRPHWRNYFADGTIDLDLPLLDNGIPNKDGYTARCARAIFVRQNDLEHLVAALPKPSGKQSSQVNLKQIAEIVTGYRQSLAGASPSLNDCRQSAHDRGLVGHRDQLDEEYHRQFPGRHTPGRPSQK